MARRKKQAGKRTRRTYPDEFKRDAVQMMLDGYSAAEVCKRLGIPNTNTLYRWKQQLVELSGPVAGTLDERGSGP